MRVRCVIVLTLVAAAAATPVLAGFAGTDLFIPMAGRGVGAYPSNWFTTVYVFNPNATAVSVDLTFLERNKDNVAVSPPKVTDTLAPGETKVYENIVETTFGKSGTVYGAVRLHCASKVVATARVYSKDSADAPLTQSFGQDFAATPASFAIGNGESTEILGGYTTQPPQDSEARYNIGCVETTGLGSAMVHWVARDADGVERGHYDRSVPRLSQTQGFFHDYFTGVELTNARISASVISGSGKVICYGSLVTNDKEFPKPVQDPTTFEMVYPEKLLGIATVQHDPTLKGDGTAGSLLGINDGAVSQGKLSATDGTAGQVLGTDGTGLQWKDDGLKLPFAGSVGALEHAAFWVTNTAENGAGVLGAGTTGVYGNGSVRGVWGDSAAASGVEGSSVTGTGVLGTSTSGWGVHGESTSGDGVVGMAAAVGKAGVLGSNPNPDGWAGRFVGKVAIAGDLACTECVHGGDIATGSVGEPQLADGSVSKGKLIATGAAAGRVLGSNGTALEWREDSLTLPFFREFLAGVSPFNGGEGAVLAIAAPSGSMSPRQNAILGSGTCSGVLGMQYGEVGIALCGSGVSGYARSGYGVAGSTDGGRGVLGVSFAGGIETSGFLGGDQGAGGKKGSFEGYLGYSDTGVLGKHTGSSNQGHLGRSDKGVWGRAFTAGGIGVHGESSNGEGVYGSGGGAHAGVHGFSTSKAGVWGESTSDAGILGTTTTGYAGYFIGRLLNTNLSSGSEHSVCADSNGVLVNCGTSDVRLKREVVDLSSEIDVASALRRLRAVAYSWDASQERARSLGDRREIGLIAQEVEAVLPQVVDTGADGYKAIDYARLTALLIEVAKAQQQEIEALKTAIAEMRH
jgi:hypothetical protein